MKRFQDKYHPTTLAEFVFASPNNQADFAMIEQNRMQANFVLHGPNGSGKTTLAKMMPKLIDPSVKETDFAVDLKNGSYYTSIVNVREWSKNLLRMNPFTDTGLRFLIIDEADGMSSEAQASLKGIINERAQDTVFIFTTNDLDKLDSGIKSRCREIYINTANAGKWLPRVKHILNAEAVPIPDDQKLMGIIRPAGGDARKILDLLEYYVLQLKVPKAA